jgi:hypothetical protein
MAFADPNHVNMHPTQGVLPETDLVLAHESALVAAGAALQEAALSRSRHPAATVPDTRPPKGLKFLRYLFLKRFG